jgi:polysaccharide deacetylase family protein (PEP-CTERM system associated)
MVNALTIDVEDYWSIFSRDWLALNNEPSDAVVKNTEWFLETLKKHQVKATFFILGEVAKKFPSLIREIAQAGHEIATHGFSHIQIFKLTQEQFRREVAESKKLLEDITAGAVTGHRAPAFSITPQTEWALEILAQEGFKYDSSVYPISSRRYGWSGFSKGICKIDLQSGRDIIEVPMSTVTVLGRTLPAAGGGYIRHFPYTVTKWAIKRIQRTRPAIVYMHPYEIDTEERAFDTKQLSYKERIRAMKFHKMQQRNRNTVGEKLIKLLSEFEFAAIREVIREKQTAFCVL